MSIVDYIITRFTRFLTNIEAYIDNHQEEIRASLTSLDNWTARVSRRFVCLMLFGLVLLLVNNFVPLEKDFPILYQFGQGLVTLLEFMVKLIFGFLYNLFTGKLSTWWDNYTTECNLLLSQFKEWLTTL